MPRFLTIFLLTAATLGPLADRQRLDNISPEQFKRYIANDVVGLLPEAIESVPGALGDVTTGKNVGEVEKTPLVESYSRDLHIATDLSIQL